MITPVTLSNRLSASVDRRGGSGRGVHVEAFAGFVFDQYGAAVGAPDDRRPVSQYAHETYKSCAG
jgi:hypothetical protein